MIKDLPRRSKFIGTFIFSTKNYIFHNNHFVVNVLGLLINIKVFFRFLDFTKIYFYFIFVCHVTPREINWCLRVPMPIFR